MARDFYLKNPTPPGASSLKRETEHLNIINIINIINCYRFFAPTL